MLLLLEKQVLATSHLKKVQKREVLFQISLYNKMRLLHSSVSLQDKTVIEAGSTKWRSTKLIQTYFNAL